LFTGRKMKVRHKGVIIGRDSGKVMVQIEDPARTCGKCRGCVPLLGNRTSPEDYVVRSQDPGDKYQVGDQVIVDSEMRPVMKAIGFLYGLPFTCLFIGYAIGRLLSGNDSVGGLAGVVGLLVGAAVARPITRRYFVQEPEYKVVSRACS
jgi:positive regulator of sigma E activity